jgi:hypothetical protein
MENTNVIKIERKNGKIVRQSESGKRRGRPTGSGNPTLKLVCLVTGKSRATNQKYLEAKAIRLGVTVDEIVKNYVSKEGMKSMDSFEHSNKGLLATINGSTRVRVEKVAKAA